MSVWKFVGEAELMLIPPVGGALRCELTDVRVLYACACSPLKILLRRCRGEKCKTRKMLLAGDLKQKTTIIRSEEDAAD